MPNKPNEPVEAHVDVILNQPDTQPAFYFESNDLAVGEDNSLEFENRRHPGFVIHYDIDDTLNPGYRFPEANVPDHLAEAIYVQVGPRCPQQKSNWPQFWPMEVVSGGKTLKVRNENRGKARFHYTLRLTKDGGQHWLNLDPGGTNKNGPTDDRFSYLLGPAVTGVITAIATIVLINNSLIPPNPVLFAIGGAVIGLLVGAVIG